MMTKEEIEKQYGIARDTPSDINLHLPILREYADRCDHVTECGVRGVVSLWAFLASKASKVVAIDICDVWTPEVEKLTFICADDLQIEIEETDFLWIDTLHNYNHCRQELALHHSKVRKYIGFHDTAPGTFGVNGDDGGKGLLFAIAEFLNEYPEFKQAYHTDNNNGCTILERI